MFNKQSQTLHIRLIQSSEEFYLLHDRWNALLNKSTSDSFFLRWEWLWSWWKAYQDEDYKLCIILVFRGDDLIGIAPFYVFNLRWKNLLNIRRLMFLGTKEGDVISEYMDIIYKEAEKEAVLRKVMESLVHDKLCDDICLHKIETSSATINFLEKMSDEMKLFYIIQDKFDSPYISLPEHSEQLAGSLTGAMLYKIRNNLRKLAKYHDVIFYKTADISQLKACFMEFIRLHQLRWESRKMPGSFSGKKFTAFQEMVMPYLFINGHLDLWFLSVNKVNIAALYNIKYGNKIYFYQSGLDTSFDKGLAPGVLLHDYCIKDAIINGFYEYDFLLMGNTDSYKKQWAKNCRYMCDIYIARPGIIKLLMSAKNKARIYYHTINKIL